MKQVRESKVKEEIHQKSLVNTHIKHMECCQSLRWNYLEEIYRVL
jgi:hypothetical protein